MCLEKFEEIPSLPVEDIKEKPKRRGRMDGHSIMKDLFSLTYHPFQCHPDPEFQWSDHSNFCSLCSLCWWKTKHISKVTQWNR